MPTEMLTEMYPREARIETATNGWIVRSEGRVMVFTKWPHVVAYLAQCLMAGER